MQKERTRINIENFSKHSSSKTFRNCEPITQAKYIDITENRPLNLEANIGEINFQVGDILNDLDCSFNVQDIYSNIDKITLNPTNDVDIGVFIQCDVVKNAERLLEYFKQQNAQITDSTTESNKTIQQ